jgi:hypothetical protein
MIDFVIIPGIIAAATEYQSSASIPKRLVGKLRRGYVFNSMSYLKAEYSHCPAPQAAIQQSAPIIPFLMYIFESTVGSLDLSPFIKKPHAKIIGAAAPPIIRINFPALAKRSLSLKVDKPSSANAGAATTKITKHKTNRFLSERVISFPP